MTRVTNYLSNKYFWLSVLVTILVACLIVEYAASSPRNLKNINYYNNSQPSPNAVISEKLKDPNTLEQEMVNTMHATTNINQPRLSPRYRPLLPNSAGASLVD